LAEQWTFNPLAASSNLARPTIFYKEPKTMNTTFELKILDQRVAVPTYSTDGSAALDLRAARVFENGDLKKPKLLTETLVIQPGETVMVGAGIAVHMLRRDVASFILPRSGTGNKGLVIGNLVGLIDSDYQGELLMSLWNRRPAGSDPFVVEPLDRVAQLMFTPVIQVGFNVVTEFSENSARGDGGFGSTGSK
jgi:dUTP pyrophosphatase